MKTSKIGIILGAFYLILAGSAIAYELSIRVYDTGNSEFAGMISFALTLPTSLLFAFISASLFGIKVGDSNTSFVLILALSAFVNACLIYAIVSALRKFVRR